MHEYYHLSHNLSYTDVIIQCEKRCCSICCCSKSKVIINNSSCIHLSMQRHRLHSFSKSRWEDNMFPFHANICVVRLPSPSRRHGLHTARILYQNLNEIVVFGRSYMRRRERRGCRGQAHYCSFAKKKIFGGKGNLYMRELVKRGVNNIRTRNMETHKKEYTPSGLLSARAMSEWKSSRSVKCSPYVS